MLIVALWEHIHAEQTLGRNVLIGAFGAFLVSTTSQVARQLYKTSLRNRQVVQLVGIS